jgi:carbamoyl-phosphate synthase large subunit
VAKHQVKFLLTSVGRRVELMRHFLESEAYREGTLDIVGTEVDPSAPAALELGDRVRIVPRFTDPGFVSAIEALCQAEGITAILPLFDPDVDVLAAAAASQGWQGAPFASVRSEHANVVSDKWLTFNWLAERGIPTPDTWLPEGVPSDADFPLFVKPRNGSASVDTYKVRDSRELEFFTSYVKNPVVQAYLGGPEVTVDVIVGPAGEILALAQRQRLMVRGGEVTRGVTIDDPAITDVVLRVVDHLRPNGPVTVQGMYDEGEFRVTECNARMGGGIPLAIAAGVPVADLLTRSWLGGSLDSPLAYQTGVVMARFDDSFFVRS